MADDLEDSWDFCSDRARTASLRKCDFEVSTEMGAGFLPSISHWTLQKEHSRQEALQMGDRQQGLGSQALLICRREAGPQHKRLRCSSEIVRWVLRGRWEMIVHLLL